MVPVGVVKLLSPEEKAKQVIVSKDAMSLKVFCLDQTDYLGSRCHETNFVLRSNFRASKKLPCLWIGNLNRLIVPF